MNALEDCIVFLIWAAWVLLNFYLKQTQQFWAWGFTEDTSLISFPGGIWSRYSEISKLKTSKGLSFQKITKTHWLKNTGFKGNF